jgi:hypothetical protein
MTEASGRARKRQGICRHSFTIWLSKETARDYGPQDANIQSIGGDAALLLDWRGRCPYNQDMDYVFASEKKHGAQPLWPSRLTSHALLGVIYLCFRGGHSCLANSSAAIHPLGRPHLENNSLRKTDSLQQCFKSRVRAEVINP